MTERAMSPGFRRLAAAVALLGCLVRLWGAGRRLDHRSLSLWHEADYTEIARSFAREDPRLLHPRIDWRRDTSGEVEMELPAMPWLAALARRAAGADERSMRLLAAAVSIAAFLLFRGLARRVLPPGAALVAAAAYALSPLAVYLATRMQPEPLMLLFVLLAAGALWRWYDEPHPGRLLAACAALAAAILLKEPAASLGLLFAWLVWRRRGWAALRDGWVYLGAAIALLPAVAWYAWAYHFWAAQGNSLGLSDEAHLVGWDVLLRRGLLGNARAEVLDVLTPLGLLLALLGLRWAARRLEPALAWYGSALVFYLVAARTAGAGWAFYYHGLSVAPACLLLGAGTAALGERRVKAGGRLPRIAAAALPALVLAALAATTLYRLAQRDGWIDAAATGVRATERRIACARQFAPLIPPDGEIAVRGIAAHDAAGHSIAYNDPTFFAFADRKGFIYPEGEGSLPTLAALARRGARYWIVAEEDLAKPSLDRAAVDRAFRRLATCPGGYALYDLAAPPADRR